MAVASDEIIDESLYLESLRERERERRRAIRHQRRIMTRGDERSRPVIRFFGHRATIPDIIFRWTPFFVLLATVVLITSDSVRAENDMPPLVANHTGLARTVVGLAIAIGGLICVDLATYQPRIFAKARLGPVSFFACLAQLDGTLRAYMDEIESTPAQTRAEAKDKEEGLISKAHEFLLLDGLRNQIRVYVLLRLSALVLSLSFVAYGLAYSQDTPLVEGLPHDAVFADYVYFGVTTFFTISYGDVHLVHGALGYAFAGLVSITLAAVLYFFLTDVLAAQTEFSNTLRASAEGFVMLKSRL